MLYSYLFSCGGVDKKYKSLLCVDGMIKCFLNLFMHG